MSRKNHVLRYKHVKVGVENLIKKAWQCIFERDIESAAGIIFESLYYTILPVSVFSNQVLELLMALLSFYDVDDNLRIRFLKYALQFKPRFETGLFMELSLLYIKNGSVQNALDVFDMMNANTRNMENFEIVLYHIALLYHQCHEILLGGSVYEKALRNTPQITTISKLLQRGFLNKILSQDAERILQELKKLSQHQMFLDVSNEQAGYFDRECLNRFNKLKGVIKKGKSEIKRYRKMGGKNMERYSYHKFLCKDYYNGFKNDFRLYTEILGNKSC